MGVIRWRQFRRSSSVPFHQTVGERDAVFLVGARRRRGGDTAEGLGRLHAELGGARWVLGGASAEAWGARRRRPEGGDAGTALGASQVLVLLLIASIVVAVAVVRRRGRIVGDREIQSLVRGFVVGGSEDGIEGFELRLDGVGGVEDRGDVRVDAVAEVPVAKRGEKARFETRSGEGGLGAGGFNVGGFGARGLGAMATAALGGVGVTAIADNFGTTRMASESKASQRAGRLWSNAGGFEGDALGCGRRGAAVQLGGIRRRRSSEFGGAVFPRVLVLLLIAGVVVAVTVAVVWLSWACGVGAGREEEVEAAAARVFLVGARRRRGGDTAEGLGRLHAELGGARWVLGGASAEAWGARRRRPEGGDGGTALGASQVLVLLLIASIVVAVAVVRRRGRIVGDREIQSLVRGFVVGGSEDGIEGFELRLDGVGGAEDRGDVRVDAVAEVPVAKRGEKARFETRSGGGGLGAGGFNVGGFGARGLGAMATAALGGVGVTAVADNFGTTRMASESKASQRAGRLWSNAGGFEGDALGCGRRGAAVQLGGIRRRRSSEFGGACAGRASPQSGGKR
uniref:Uncharacterized protein n=1 Tax=Ananas comosus var. bracteatus TaxID=296719 RepID=A0A6V7PGZ8_ANACO|nr:unnamed protein product [Ananas comosus var. bracteatus]